MALRILDDHFARFHIENESGSGVESPVDKFHGGELNYEADKSGDSSDGLLLSGIACPVDKLHEEDSNSESDNSEYSSDGPLSSYNDSVESQDTCISHPMLHLELESQDMDTSYQMFQEYDTIEKHPNFSKLIDMSSLKVEDLPPVYRHTEMLDLINSLAAVVIKISFIDNNGRFITGSGIVDDVMLSSDDDCVSPCMCDSCSSPPAKEWGSFSVVTAAKLTCGSAENIQKFVCSLFYDTEDQINVQQLHGHKLVTYNAMKDLLIFSCVTSDVSLLRKLKEGRDTFSDSWKKSFLKYYQTVKWEQEKIVFVVYHPYGLRKHLSIGHQFSSRDDGVEGHLTGYDLATCPGCIGAYVLVPDFNVVEDDDFFFGLSIL